MEMVEPFNQGVYSDQSNHIEEVMSPFEEMILITASSKFNPRKRKYSTNHGRCAK